MRPIAVVASAVWAPTCGVIRTSARRRSWWSAGGGSWRRTSSAAPRRHPDSSAATRSSSTTNSPRAVLIRNALLGNFESSSRLTRSLVSGVTGKCKDRKSAVPIASSRETIRTPCAVTNSSVTPGSLASTVQPKALARQATACPIRPKPRRLKVFPAI